MSPCHPVTPSLRRSLARSDLPVLALLLGLILLFFWKLAFTNLIIARGDIFYYFYPYRDYAASALRDGHIPLWNPYLFMGAPFLANSQVGFFYPLNLLMSWLDTARAINWTIVLHIFIAASGVYVFARHRLGLSISAAWLAAVSFGLGGYLGTQIEHVNQLQGLAWIGWIFLAYEAVVSSQLSVVSNRQLAFSLQRLAIRNALMLALLIAVQLLAGHTQAVYITLFGLGIYAAWPAIELIVKQPRRVASTLAARLWPILFASILAVALSAIQLLPTLELTRLSARSGGLPTNLAVSFSLDPRWLGRALLPDYAGAMPAGGEFTSFFSVAALFLMIVGGLSFWLKRGSVSNLQLPTSRFRSVSIVAVLGLVLAFGGYTPIYYALLKIVPGFDLFRAPARWLVLFVFAGSLLAGVGLDVVRERRINWKSLLLPIAFVAVLIALTFIAAGLTPAGAAGPLGIPDAKSAGLWLGVLALSLACCVVRVPFSLTRNTQYAIRPLMLALLICADLFLATRPLPYNSRATAPDALTSLRPAVTHLKVGAEDRTPPDRFLSISDIQFDPGDSAELKSIYGDQLSADAFYDLIVATKAKEIVAPNLPLYYRLPAVDGYDGGLLPLKNYMTFQRLFLEPNLIQPDGRLREQLKSIPDARWLDLMNARYIITDKVGDQWYDGVLYDLQFATRLAPGHSAYTDQVPRFKADALGLVYSEPMGNSTLAQIEVAFTDGLTQTLILIDAPITTTNGLSVARLTWDEPHLVNSIRVTGVGGLTVHGAALIDQRSQSFQSFVLMPHGNFGLAHSGDVKVYENAAALPRAFVVSDVRAAASDDETIALMQGADFDPSRTVVLIGNQSNSPDHSVTPSPCHFVTYTPEYAAIDVDAAQDGYLVLTDAYYPGWVATIDGQPTNIERADVMFRAVKVPAGQHRVEMRYEPQSFRIGMWVTIGAWAILIAAWAVVLRGRTNAK